MVAKVLFLFFGSGGETGAVGFSSGKGPWAIGLGEREKRLTEAKWRRKGTRAQNRSKTIANGEAVGMSKNGDWPRGLFNEVRFTDCSPVFGFPGKGEL
jgi:hypothetical protein